MNLSEMCCVFIEMQCLREFVKSFFKIHSKKVHLVIQNMLPMPQSALKFPVAAVLYAVQSYNFEVGHV